MEQVHVFTFQVIHPTIKAANMSEKHKVWSMTGLDYERYKKLFRCFKDGRGTVEHSDFAWWPSKACLDHAKSLVSLSHDLNSFGTVLFSSWTMNWSTTRTTTTLRMIRQQGQEIRKRRQLLPLLILMKIPLKGPGRNNPNTGRTVMEQKKKEEIVIF